VIRMRIGSKTLQRRLHLLLWLPSVDSVQLSGIQVDRRRVVSAPTIVPNEQQALTIYTAVHGHGRSTIGGEVYPGSRFKSVRLSGPASQVTTTSPEGSSARSPYPVKSSGTHFFWSLALSQPSLYSCS